MFIIYIPLIVLFAVACALNIYDWSFTNYDASTILFSFMGKTFKKRDVQRSIQTTIMIQILEGAIRLVRTPSSKLGSIFGWYFVPAIDSHLFQSLRAREVAEYLLPRQSRDFRVQLACKHKFLPRTNCSRQFGPLFSTVLASMTKATLGSWLWLFST